jgi:hypothetical protein
MPHDYKCEHCGGTFTSERSDEEARAEALATWSEDPESGTMSLICDDCYQQFMAWYARQADAQRSA